MNEQPRAGFKFRTKCIVLLVTAAGMLCVPSAECTRPILTSSSSSSQPAIQPQSHFHISAYPQGIAGSQAHSRVLQVASRTPDAIDAAAGSQTWDHGDGSSSTTDERRNSSSSSSSSSGDAYASARVITVPPPDTHNIVHAVTPEAAEAVAYSDPSGIHRLATPERRRSYATVEPDALSNNPNRNDMTVRTFARSNQDLPSRFRRRDNNGNGGNSYNNVNNLNHKHSKSSENDPKYSSSGAVEQPILAVGELAYAQTSEGATAVAASDAIALSKGGRVGSPDGTTIAASNAMTWVPGLLQANAEQQSSVVVSTSQRVGSLAASGAADGRLALAQADTAVALAQAESTEWDELDEDNWHDPSSFMTQDWSDPDSDDKADGGT